MINLPVCQSVTETCGENQTIKQYHSIYYCPLLSLPTSRKITPTVRVNPPPTHPPIRFHGTWIKQCCHGGEITEPIVMGNILHEQACHFSISTASPRGRALHPEAGLSTQRQGSPPRGRALHPEAGAESQLGPGAAATPREQGLTEMS